MRHDMERAAPARHSHPLPARPEEVVNVQCPRCGRSKARVIGQSDALPIVYLRCDACHQTSVAGARL
jgi:hypothetical protein